MAGRTTDAPQITTLEARQSPEACIRRAVHFPQIHRCRPRANPAKSVQPHWRPAMTWETPAACDFRFGFEITMYIAAR
jgi:pyrroloquinoline quinone biosynthesis protein A